MRRLSMIVLLTLMTPIALAQARPAPKTIPNSERSSERANAGADAKKETIPKKILQAIAESGYRDVQVVSWLVMMAKNPEGREVMLLVEPVSLLAVEIDNGAEISDAKAKTPETALPKLHR